MELTGCLDRYRGSTQCTLLGLKRAYIRLEDMKAKTQDKVKKGVLSRTKTQEQVKKPPMELSTSSQVHVRKAEKQILRIDPFQEFAMMKLKAGDAEEHPEVERGSTWLLA